MPSICSRKEPADIDRAITLSRSTRYATWSVLETVETMDEVATEGTGLSLTYDVEPHWVGGGEGERHIVIALPANPTWNDLFAAAEQAMKRSGDRHHRFIEDFDLDPAARTLELWTGS